MLIHELRQMLMSYKKTQVMNLRVRICRHRAAIFCQLLGSPERNNSSPHLAAPRNHPVGGRYLAKLMKGNPWWGEEGWRGAERQLEREKGKDHVGEVGWMGGWLQLGSSLAELQNVK